MKKVASRNGRPGLGWMPDLPDNRDHLYSAPLAKLRVLPTKVDLRRRCPRVYNQGQIGSCTANAIAAAIEFDRKKQKLRDFIPSRLFIYYNERSIEHSIPLDNGAQIRDGIKSVAKQGACPETEWTYNDTPADSTTNLWPPGAKPRQKPTPSCYKDAKKIPRGELSTSRSDAFADERLPGRRFSVRVWLYRLRQLRERENRQDGRAANA
jgi:C1A family cysteine protease